MTQAWPISPMTQILTARFARMGTCPAVTRQLPTDDSCQVLNLATTRAAAAAAIHSLMGQFGTVLESGEEVLGIVKTGFLRMNPAVLRVRCIDLGNGTTSVDVRASAKEGLIKQRGGHQAVQEFVARFASLMPVEWMA